MSDATPSTPRIEQFRKMASDDPQNVLAHFSLGQEYFRSGQFEPALESLSRAIELEPNLSKAYLLTGQSLLQLNRRDAAIEQLTRGMTIAHARGDVMPKNEIAKLLLDIGAPVPELKSEQATQPVGEGEIRCKKCGLIKPKLAAPPMRNEFGKLVQENTCADCWREAIGYGTKVINELRLPLADPQANKMWDQHIREFLNLV
jgi:tetratricopeptide (TPR) repeat protein